MQDVLIDNNGALQFVNGDFAVGESDGQHIALLLHSQSGEWGEYPTAGVGISDVLLDNNTLYWEHRIAQQLEADGVTVSKIKLADNKLELDAAY